MSSLRTFASTQVSLGTCRSEESSLQLQWRRDLRDQSHQIGLPAGVRLGKNALKMCLDGRETDGESIGRLLRRVPLCDELEHPALGRGQSIQFCEGLHRRTCIQGWLLNDHGGDPWQRSERIAAITPFQGQNVGDQSSALLVR